MFPDASVVIFLLHRVVPALIFLHNFILLNFICLSLYLQYCIVLDYFLSSLICTHSDKYVYGRKICLSNIKGKGLVCNSAAVFNVKTCCEWEQLVVGGAEFLMLCFEEEQYSCDFWKLRSCLWLSFSRFLIYPLNAYLLTKPKLKFPLSCSLPVKQQWREWTSSVTCTCAAFAPSSCWCRETRKLQNTWR